jgi:hypothetical protein
MEPGNKTLDMTLHIRHLTEDQAKEIRNKIDEAVVLVTGSVPASSHMLKPDYAGPGRSVEEAKRAAAEGRR